jgi:hypothetical protein
MSAPTIDDILNANDSDEDIDGISVNLEQLLDDEDSDDEGDLDLDMKISDFKKNVPPPSKLVKDSTSTINHTSSNIEQNINTVPVETKEISELLLALGEGKVEDKFQIRLPEPIEIATIDQDFDNYNDTGGINDPDFESNKQVTLLSTLELAERREQKLVNGGDRDIISALHAKIASNSEKIGASNSAPKPSSQYSNLKCAPLETISSQLSRNAQFSQHGPGIATIVKITSKYIAIGTSRGLVLLFDNSTQEMKQVLGSHLTASVAPIVSTNTLSINNNSNNSNKILSITALDITVSGDIIICGYDNGELILWDVQKGTIIKRVDDLHTCRIMYVGLVYKIGSMVQQGNQTPAASGMTTDISVITIDQKGTVQRSVFNKIVWVTTCDSACLLDGSAGIMTDLVSLPAYQSQKSLASVCISILCNYRL